MKKQKLSLEKFNILKLTNTSIIYGGTNTTDPPPTTTTDDPFPTRTGCMPPPSIDPNDPYGECGG